MKASKSPKKTEGSSRLAQLYTDDEGSSGIDPQQLVFGEGNKEAIRHTCEAIGQVIETWGFKKILGMTWAFVYLCPEPASAKDIGTALSISPALVSITLQDLIRWGVVKKISPLGKRKDFYVAEHDVWKMIRKVLRERERNQMDMVRKKLLMAVHALDDEGKRRPDLKSKRTCQFQKLRIEDLLSITVLAIQLMDQFTDEGSVNVSPIFQLLKPLGMMQAAVAAPKAN
jgi:DNA-binding transcriptional regulator GbsR (MarR family)